MRDPRYVVTTESHDDGIAGTRAFSHYYATGYFDISGRGWASRAPHRVNDIDRGTYTLSYLDRAFPFVGMPTRQDLYRASDNRLLRSVVFGLDETSWST